MDISGKIRELKEKSGLTAKELADAAGVSASSLNKVLSGETANPSFQMVAAIAAVCGASLDEIAGLTDSIPPEHFAVSRELVEAYKEALARQHKWLRVFFIALSVVMAFVLAMLCLDFCNGNIGWVRR